MKTELSIYLDYRNAMTQARQLDEAAGILSHQAENLDNCCIEIASAWDGEDSENYIRKARLLGEKLTNAARNTRIAADTIRGIAEKTYQAEKTALQIASARTYR